MTREVVLRRDGGRPLRFRPLLELRQRYGLGPDGHILLGLYQLPDLAAVTELVIVPPARLGVVPCHAAGCHATIGQAARSLELARPVLRPPAAGGARPRVAVIAREAVAIGLLEACRAAIGDLLFQATRDGLLPPADA